ncbi:5'-nucleotidase C-terminal domain-containing protein [Faecalibacterium prausnitzii]|uniref:Twin-arginine translocation signal domain-containing protein n=1 Tax=Faecalibacterium prausnitzii TaxID=853 RepID=A0A6A8KMF7_9FIRM|nr:twin-arginine translocation signal domain-containing protein [Faecalibacterium prausnitzii]MSC47661.1 twin-arginine translocation signal domain-containing protein [Faecalibacterium prausnitzii]MSC67889.1 twin-arginine translocation signal domain-containing protein [Faecalibacterium prausnitzii]MSC73961.1 twin-arginine translocation signal domain-containing protein [Faecalibacterium prausnitzii]MSC79486.1 twin-arginine translocation signal domain-containing protein [Faecalibacterium prausnitz
MKQLISRRSFLKAAGVTAAAASMAIGAPAASACWLGDKSDVTILYTNDVHTYIDKQSPKLTYAAIADLKQSYQNAGKDVLLVDAGDHVQGTAYGSMDEGASIIKLMNAAGYDVATPGNHEFDYGMDRAKAIMKEADFPYLSCNWVDLRTTLRVLPSVKVFVRGGRRIAFVGVTTPETFTKSTPAYFMDKAQRKYIYDIQGGEDGKKLYDAVQKAIDKAKLLADVVIGLGHLGVDPSSSPWTSEEVIAHTSGFDAFIDGHSHTVMENKQVQDASGKAVTLTQTGSYFANVGEMTIAADGTITTKLIPTHEGMDAGIAAMQTGWVNTVDDMLGEKIAVGDSDFYVSDPATGKRRIRSAETNLGDFVADGIYTYFNEVEKLHCDVAIMNGGGIRADVPAGDWTFKTCKQISPFGNVACLMSVTGKQIQDALEFAARFAGEDGKENGGFLQVAGATYEIHTDIPNTVQTDEKNVWIGSATGTPRVQNVKIYDKASGSYLPLDPGATYALAGMNYTLRNLGDGFAMFDGAELIKDYVSEDYLVMSTYAMIFDGADAAGLPHLSSANSPLAAYPGYLLNYEQPYGAGRITIL